MMKEFVYLFVAMITVDGGSVVVSSETVESKRNCQITQAKFEYKLDKGDVEDYKTACVKIKNTRHL